MAMVLNLILITKTHLSPLQAVSKISYNMRWCLRILCIWSLWFHRSKAIFLWSWKKPMDGRWIWLILKSPTGAVEFGQSTTSSVFPDISISLYPFLWGNLQHDPLKYQGMLSCKCHALIWPGPKSIEKDQGHPSIILWYVCQYLPCIYVLAPLSLSLHVLSVENIDMSNIMTLWWKG